MKKGFDWQAWVMGGLVFAILGLAFATRLPDAALFLLYGIIIGLFLLGVVLAVGQARRNGRGRDDREG